MKMNKKKVLTVALIVIMVAILSFSTLAWFNAADEVTNKFMVADSDGNGTPDFSVDVKEEVVKPDGTPVKNEYTDEGNTYEDILPGDNLPKIVSVRNTGDYDQWLRVHITFSDSAVWQQAIAKAAAAEGVTFDAYVVDHLLVNLFDWTCEAPVVSYNVFGEDTMTYTFYFNAPVTPNQGVHVMSGVKIPGVLVQEDMNFGTDGFTVTVKAEAVQVENLKAAKASEAFEEVGWKIGTAYGE